MAAGAGRARRRERPTHVAALASHIRVSSIEYKSGAEMIERLLSVDGVHGKQQADC